MPRPWALVALLALAACSGGSSDNTRTVPTLAWGGFRHDSANSAIGRGVSNNKGEVILLYPTKGGTTGSTPAVDNNGVIFLGTRDGLVSLDKDGLVRWTADACELESGQVIPLGPIFSSPTVTAGRDIVVATEATATTPGMVFDFRERSSSVADCKWAFVPGVASIRSSAQVQVDALDLSLLSVFIGTGDGTLQAINGTGTPRWAFPAAPGPITSTVAVDPSGPFYVTTPDGVLTAIDSAGRPLWRLPIGAPPAGALQQSPAVGASIYAFGANGALFGINPSGTVKWQYQPQAIVPGSPAFAAQSIDVGSEVLLDTIVYLADENGDLYGVRDQTGEIWDRQYCFEAKDVTTCRMDGCPPDKGTCDAEKNRCCVGDTCNDTKCTPDSCQSGQGTCVSTPALIPVNPDEAVPVETSPAVSGDFFIIVGTADGRVCARNLDTTVPGDKDNPSNPWLSNGCIALGDGLPVRSSPAIGPGGAIHVTTDSGLYIIK
ncbi:MAG: PQQ-binding-like beta-propeller repeat protein [Candidatus Binatia bacterium]